MRYQKQSSDPSDQTMFLSDISLTIFALNGASSHHEIPSTLSRYYWDHWALCLTFCAGGDIDATVRRTTTGADDSFHGYFLSA